MLQIFKLFKKWACKCLPGIISEGINDANIELNIDTIAGPTPMCDADCNFVGWACKDGDKVVHYQDKAGTNLGNTPPEGWAPCSACKPKNKPKYIGHFCLTK